MKLGLIKILCVATGNIQFPSHTGFFIWNHILTSLSLLVLVHTFLYNTWLLRLINPSFKFSMTLLRVVVGIFWKYALLKYTSLSFFTTVVLLASALSNTWTSLLPLQRLKTAYQQYYAVMPLDWVNETIIYQEMRSAFCNKHIYFLIYSRFNCI